MVIQIGKAIYSILMANSTVTGYTGTKIYPLVIPENTTLPCVVYERLGNVEYTRDGIGMSSSLVDLTILSEDYAETVAMSQAIYNALNMYAGTVGDIKILNIQLQSVNEVYAENAFIQKLTFTCKSI